MKAILEGTIRAGVELQAREAEEVTVMYRGTTAMGMDLAYLVVLDTDLQRQIQGK